MEDKVMSTYLAKTNEVERSWYVIDAAGKPLGRVAAQAAVLLRGKHKAIFTPNADCGDHVIIINCKDAILTGGSVTQVISVILKRQDTILLWLQDQQRLWSLQ